MIDNQAVPPSRPPLRYVDPFRARGWLYRLFCRLSITKAGMWLSEKIAWKADPVLMRMTRGRFSSTGPIASALLETRGARSGKIRRNAALYFHDGHDIVIVASKRGWPTHPAWYHNVRKDPDVVFGGLPFRAEIVHDEGERARLWELADRVFPPFADYRQWAGKGGRSIPIVRLVARR